MTNLPRLGTVPSPYACIDSDLTVKASHTGITILQERRYRKRYTGSKQSAVDINGNLYLSAAELDKIVKGERKDNQVKRVHKKSGGATPADKVMFRKNEPQISENNPVFPASVEEIAKKPRKKLYSVNKKEVRQRIHGYLNSQRGSKHLYFWTVSFPEGTPDAVAYRAWNTWLTSLRKYRMLKDYIWVAERQDGTRNADGRATNTVHFHIAIPHFMNVQRANAMMRGTLKNLAKAGDLPYSVQSPQIAKYNGVDICKHRKTKRVVNFAIKKGSIALANYLTKYVTKNDTEFEHLAWHNSRGFSALFTGVTFTVTEFKNFGFQHFLNKVRVFRMNFAIFIPWLYGPPPLLIDHLFKLNSYIQHVTDGEAALHT